MDLRTYLFEKRMTVRAFAESIEMAPEYIAAIKRGKPPGIKLCKKIEIATGGLVKLEPGKKNWSTKRLAERNADYYKQNDFERDTFQNCLN